MSSARHVVGVIAVVVLSQSLASAKDNPSRWGSSSGGTGWTSGEGYGCLGIAPGQYTSAVLWTGISSAVMDNRGRLHVHADGTYAWALYPYSDSITGPYDTAHQQLYIGSTEISFTYVIDPSRPETYGHTSCRR